MAGMVRVPGGTSIPDNSRYMPTEGTTGTVLTDSSDGIVPIDETLKGMETTIPGTDYKIDTADYVRSIAGGGEDSSSYDEVDTDSSDSYSDSSDSYSDSSSSSSTTKTSGVTRKPISISKDGSSDRNWLSRKIITGGGTVSKPAITGIGSRELITKINVNRSNLEMNSQKIKSAASKLDSIWSDIKTNQIGRINSSWVGSAAEAYTSKVLGMESKINAVKEALQLIAKNYDAAISEIDSKQSELTSKINNI